MATIDLEKFICSLIESKSSALNDIAIIDICNALSDQGLEYMDGVIVEVEPKKEPKFKVGDWVVCEAAPKYSAFITGDVVQISNVAMLELFLHCKDCFRHWTIQDAKDGDVLATLDYILVFKEFLKNDGGISYCHYDFGAGNPQFIWSEDKNWYFGKEAIIHPATKKQCDLLFQKMHEAGYEWDADKKELKKIDNEEFNGEDYGIDSLYHAQRILENTLGKVDGYQTDDGILAHKCAISAVKQLAKQKPWSEEDIATIHRVISIVKWAAYSDHSHPILNDEGATELVERLKSLKEKYTWKPSDRELGAILAAIGDERQKGSDVEKELLNIYQQLKKLREE